MAEKRLTDIKKEGGHWRAGLPLAARAARLFFHWRGCMKIQNVPRTALNEEHRRL